MARFNTTKAIQGAIDFGTYGAQLGQQLKKRYGNKAVAIGAGVGALSGAAQAGLSGSPDPNLEQNVYDAAYANIETDVMRGAHSAAREAGQVVGQAFAKRGINSSPLAAGVEAANVGRIYRSAQESLTPLRARLEMQGAQDKLNALRVGEYENRQGWSDTLLATGMAATNMVSDLQQPNEPTLDEMRATAREFGGIGGVEPVGELRATDPVAINSATHVNQGNPYNPDPNTTTGQPEDWQRKALKEQSFEMRGSLPSDTQEQLKDAAKQPTTQIELQQWLRNTPKAITALINSKGYLGEAWKHPVVGEVFAALAAEVGDEQAAELIAIYNKYA